MLNKLLRISTSVSPEREEHWIPLSDLMTGVMMIFMLVAIIFMVQVEAEAKRIEEIALVYDDMRDQLYQDLHAEFKDDLPGWGAELTPDMTLRFKEPNVLFDRGDDSLKPRFVEILNDFFPRYANILTADKYRQSIDEIRIEGHTSSVWNRSVTKSEAYFLNMALSQSRTRSVLRHVLMLPQVGGEQTWLMSHVTANGLSSSKLMLHPDGSENAEVSRRVEFRVRTNSDARISQIIKATQQ